MHDPLIHLFGRNIDGDHRLGFLPAPCQCEAEREILPGLGVGVGAAHRCTQQFDRTGGIARQRHRQPAIARRNAVGMCVERLACRAPIAGRDLGEREIERRLAVARLERDRIGIGLARRIEAAGLEIGGTEQDAERSNLRSKPDRRLGMHDCNRDLALGERLLRLAGFGRGLPFSARFVAGAGEGHAADLSRDPGKGAGERNG